MERGVLIFRNILLCLALACIGIPVLCLLITAKLCVAILFINSYQFCSEIFKFPH